MTYLQRLLRVEIRAFIALMIVATLVAIIVATSQSALPNSISGWITFAVLGFGSALLYGFLPVVLYGAPVYALLSQMRRATLVSSAIIGMAPGVIVMIVGLTPSFRNSDVNVALGSILAASGFAVAAITHWLTKSDQSVANAL